MARTYPLLSVQEETHIRTLMQQSTSVWEYRRLQCVAMRRIGLAAEDTARLVGIGKSSVLRIWSRYRRQGIAALLGEHRGRVRGRARWSREEEQAFLQPFLQRAERGHLTTVRQIFLAHCEAMGRKLHPTLTYRLLDRHGWRKVLPRPTHPKADTEAQKQFQVFFPPDRDQGESARTPLWAPFPVEVRG